MLYSHLEIWTGPKGEIWHSLYRPGTRDMSMGVLSESSLKKTLAWAQEHHLTIIDKRLPREYITGHEIFERYGRPETVA